ncbi:MAG: PD-(D/E)XK nuclease family protein, partial [Lentisphaeria bacterium]|nr:PD-(D/E)XK nuclease family protein [Lentisphaeria bacterium]
MKKLVFLGFEGPLPELAAKRLLEGAAGDTAGPDYSSALLILPGSFAVREFYRNLAESVPDGLFPPAVMTQGRFLEEGRNLEHAATEEESLIVRAQVLFSCDYRKYPSLFAEGKAPSFSDCFHLGKMLSGFLSELNLGGMTLADALVKAPGADEERRKEILELEELYHARLARFGLVDRFALLHFALPESGEKAAAQGEDLPGIKKIIVCGVPGLLSAVQARLERFADDRELEIWIQAPSSMKDFFDEWGSPIPEKWEKVAFEQGKDEETFFHTEKASDLAKLAVAVAGREGHLDNEKCSLVCADASLIPFFREALERFAGKEVQIYDPSGVPFAATRLGKLLRMLIRFARQGDFESFRELIRHEDFLLFCASFAGLACDEFLARMDKLMLEHLPDDFSTVPSLAQAGEKAVLEEVLSLREKLRTIPLAENLASVLTQIYAVPFDRKDTLRVSFESQALHLEKFLKSCIASPVLKDLPQEEFFSLLSDHLESAVLYGEFSSERIELHGFLELPNLPAQELFLCGMSEGIVPERIDPNPFLNESQRQALGLPGNAQREARDAFYLYESIARRRKTGGRVRFFVSRFSADGTPARFSPFLFRGETEHMLARARLLFSAPAAMPEKKGRQIASDDVLYYRIPVEKYREKLENFRIPVTAFDTFLTSPLRFFLQYVMEMKTEDYSLRELNDLAFGTACHAVFEKLPEGPMDEKRLREAMEALLDEHLRKVCGEKLPFLVEFQKDLILQRLYGAVPVLLEEKKEFPQVCAKEYTLGGKVEDGGNAYVEFAGLRIAGRIDRIELARDRKTLRILDIKTFNTFRTPREAHCRAKKGVLEFSCLQLP